MAISLRHRRPVGLRSGGTAAQHPPAPPPHDTSCFALLRHPPSLVAWPPPAPCCAGGAGIECRRAIMDLSVVIGARRSTARLVGVAVALRFRQEIGHVAQLQE